MRQRQGLRASEGLWGRAVGARSPLRPACGEHPPTPGAKMTEPCGGGVWGAGAGLGNKTHLPAASPDGKPGSAEGSGGGHGAMQTTWLWSEQT